MMKKLVVREDGMVYCDGELCGGDISIVSFRKNDEEGTYEEEISFLDAVSRTNVSTIIDRKTLTAKKLAEIMLERGGINCNPKVMMQHFRVRESEAINIRMTELTFKDKIGKRVDIDGNPRPEELVMRPPIKSIHNIVGWIEGGTGLEFLGTEKHTRNGVEDSEYEGSLKIQPQGDFEEYCELLKNVVVGNIPLEAILAIGASATVLEYANLCWEMNIYNPVVHICGNSSSGKTTAVMLAVSVGGCPEKQKGASIFLTFNGTLNALMKKIGKNKGYAVAIDELSMVGQKNISEFVYALADGTDKERLTKRGEDLQCRDDFATTILTNGECSLLTKCNGNEGLRARIYEFDGINWTTSAEEADKIKAQVSENYGFVVPLVVDELLTERDEVWRVKMREWKQKFVEKARENDECVGITERVANSLALFMMSAEILQKVLVMEFSIEKIFQFFYDEVIKKLAEESNIGARAYNWIRDYYIQHKDFFPEQEWNSQFSVYCPPNAEGIVIGLKKEQIIHGVVHDRTICLTEKQAEKILKKGNFSDVKVCMRAMKDMGLLMTHSKAHLYGEFHINNEKCKGYRIMIPEESYESLVVKGAEN